ncbi:MAG: hypothetical protein KYX69_11820 [Sphingomonas sp.]|uniref:hypothetical protein n=1 Tax=Sphingomonas sp. TaxID=28214 RepID=UPI002628DF03|nr:hypothetical protein [Sphingomonas sp.]MDK2768394.1 hypothetical protein [Sphingomonas sp.]
MTDFIATAKARNPIGVADWNAIRWPFPKRSRASAASEGGLVFSLRSANTADPGEFPEPFMSFVKAMVCVYNTRSSQLYAVGQSQTLIAAARLLFAEIRDRGGDPALLVHGDFDGAANKAAALMGEGAANIGSKLKVIADEIDRHGLTRQPIGWRNPISRDHKHDRVGEKALKRRHAKLPPLATLDAIAHVSARDDLDDRDLVLQRAIDLLVCGGFRINEVLTLPRNTWVEEPSLDEDGNQLVDRFGKPAVNVGLRYWPEKGGHEVAQIKWLPTVMVDLARRAVDDLLRITAPYAATALHQRAHPGSTLLGEPWDGMPDDALLTTADVAAAVGLSVRMPQIAGRQFAVAQELEMIRVNTRGKPILVPLGSLRRRLFERSFHGNVLNGLVGTLDVADCLFVVPYMFVKRSQNRGIAGTVQLITDAMVQVYLVSQANGSQPSVFERLGYLDENGEPLRLNSHQFRHLLNTLAAEGSVSEMEIARWMGRRQPSQNAAYQHVTPMARAEALRERLRGGQSIGPVADHVMSIRDPVRREEFIATTTATAHVTDLGFCVHPWDSLPCAEFGSCTSCTEHRFLKGDPASRARAEADLRQTEEIIGIAETESADGTYGADNWLEAHRTTADSLRRIVATHDDDSVPDGTLVQLDRRPTHRRSANDA